MYQTDGVTRSAPQITTRHLSENISSEAAQRLHSQSGSEPADLIERIAMRALAFGADSAMRRDHAKLPASNEAPSTAPDTAPTVNVTIGRVEVRAIYPLPQAQPARRAHSSPMSLDEYFKKRNGERG
jgi:hypothetical protein